MLSLQAGGFTLATLLWYDARVKQNCALKAVAGVEAHYTFDPIACLPLSQRHNFGWRPYTAGAF